MQQNLFVLRMQSGVDYVWRGVYADMLNFIKDKNMNMNIKILMVTCKGPGRMIVYPRPDRLNASSPAWKGKDWETSWADGTNGSNMKYLLGFEDLVSSAWFNTRSCAWNQYEVGFNASLHKSRIKLFDDDIHKLVYLKKIWINL